MVLKHGVSRSYGSVNPRTLWENMPLGYPMQEWDMETWTEKRTGKAIVFRFEPFLDKA